MINKKNIILRIVLGIAVFCINFLLAKELLANKFIIFSWCCLTALVITCLAFKNNKKLLALMGIYSVISCVRMNLILTNLVSYSIYFILLPLLVNWVFFINSNNKVIEKIDIKKALTVFLIVFAGIITSFSIFTKKLFYDEIDTPKGKIINIKDYTKPFEKTIKWIEENTHKNDTILMLPEGPLINFITGRPTSNKYYHLIPNHIEALGEEKIVDDLYENPPEFVLINSLKYSAYGNSNICDNFGNLICAFVKVRYDHITRYDYGEQADRYFFIDIYKLKKTD